MGDYNFTRLERLAIMRVCIDLAGADGYIDGDENDMLDEIANDIDLTNSDMRSLYDIDFETASNVIADLYEYEKGYVRWAIMHIVQADGEHSYDEHKLVRLVDILVEL